MTYQPIFLGEREVSRQNLKVPLLFGDTYIHMKQFAETCKMKHSQLLISLLEKELISQNITKPLKKRLNSRFTKYNSQD